MRRRIPVVLAIGMCTAVVYAQLREKPAATAASAAYRVTAWPDHSGPDQRYGEEVQEFLNRMAADGWRYHSDLVGQFGKMMLFERAERR